MKLIDVDKIRPQTTLVRAARPTCGRLLADLAAAAARDVHTAGGYAEDIVCRTDSRTLIDLHLKRLGCRAAILQGRVDLIGPPRLTNQFENWFRTSPFADFIPVEPVAQAGDELEGVLDAGAVRDG